MSAVIASASWPTWARAALALLAGSSLTPVPPVATVRARLLPPAPQPSTEPPPANPRPKPKPRRAIVAAPPVPTAAPLAAAPIAATAAPAADAEPIDTAKEAVEPVAEAAAAPAETRNAERPVEHSAAIDAVEFEAAGPALAVALAPSVAANTMLPAKGRYVYQTTNSELRLASGTTTVDRVLADDGRYRLRLATTAVGMTLLELESRGTVQRFGLAPERYVETRERRGAVAANFDWGGRRVTFSARTLEHPLPDGVQDRVSLQFQLMLLGQALPERFKAGRQTVLRIASREDVSSYRLRSAGRDRTMTGLGELATVKVERIVDRETDGRIEVWLAPDHGWLPARLRFTDRHGRVTESVLEAVASP